MKIGLIFAAVVLFGSMSLWAGDSVPSLKVVVRNAAGDILPVANQIQMKDALNSGFDITRQSHPGDQQSAFFGPEDFKGFMVSGVGPDGDPQTGPFERKVNLSQAFLKVKLDLNVEGQVPQSRTISVPVGESVEYTFTLEG